MPMDSDVILEEALKLPAQLRGKIVAGLLASLDDEVDADYEEAWSEEIQRRIEEARVDPSCRIPWAEARKMIMSDDDGD